MGYTEHNNIDMILQHKDDGVSIMSVKWTYNGRPVGVWIEYNRETSHEKAFIILSQGMWKAMQSPPDFYVDQAERGEMTVKPYWTNLR